MSADQYLIATTTSDFRMGRYNRHIPAGTEVAVRCDAIEDGREYVMVRVVGRERISHVLHVSALIPA